MKTKMKMMLPLLALASMQTKAQDVKESVQPLSKSATKGYVYDVKKEEGGNTTVTYRIPGDKKSPTITYQEYAFDAGLKFVGDKNIDVPKETHEPRERTTYYATVGGSNSFNVTSMKLKLNKDVAKEVWSQESQRYIVEKYISSETIKAKNDNQRVYNGYASYTSEDITKSDVFAIAKIESKEKAKADTYYILHFNDKLEISEKAVDISGSYSLVYCTQLTNENVVMVFAPNKKAADVTKYVYLEYDIAGNLKNKTEFKSPASALLITSSFENNGNVYLCGSSMKSADAYAEVFSEYAPIISPGATYGNNIMDMRWINASEKKMENFHLLKFNGDKMIFASTTHIADFKSKYKKSPNGKSSDPYKGRKFYIEKFYVTADEDYLIAGQLTANVNMGNGNSVKSYEDIVCLHFDKNGALKAQYGVNKMNDDKKSEIFEMKQNFLLSGDGKSLYWEILEVKGDKGYAGFWDAYNDRPTFYAQYFPRIGKIDLAASSLGDFKVMGDGKYFLNKHFTGTWDDKEKSKTYIGRDEDKKNLWMGKVTFQ